MVSGENPWSGPEIEIVFDGADDPFAEYFAPEIGGAVERCVMRGPDDFAARRHVASREGAALARRLPDLPSAGLPESRADDDAPHGLPAGASDPAEDDSDMLVIEEDLWIPPPRDGAWRVTPVRNDDYRRLFARMRRGDGRE